MKASFTDTLTNGKFAEKSVLNAKVTTAKKINVSFFVHFFKHSFSFDIFRT